MPSRTMPWITLALVATIGLAAFAQHWLPGPAWHPLLAVRARAIGPASWTWTFGTLFLHWNLLHAAGNMAALWIFGDNVEDRLGHGRFLGLFLVAGLAAAWTARLGSPGALAPVVGASGAVAAVMGAYFVLFPRSQVLFLIPLPVVFDAIEVPALLVPACWLVVELLAVDPRTVPVAAAGWAHAGGLAVGLVLGRLLARPERLRVEWWSP